MMTLKGALEDPACVIALRSGIAVHTRRGRRGRQHGISRPISEGLTQTMASFRERVHRRLQRFSDLKAEISLQALFRQRRVTPNQVQIFEGFWGALKTEGNWDSVFGATGDRDPVFRRGIWEQWHGPSLPRLEHPAPRLPLVFSPYCTTLLHEAVGHAMEADYLRHSPLRYRYGELVAHPELTVMDRPDLPHFAGSMKWDDTGQSATQTTLIHRGFLVGDLDHDKGVWRRASYRELPQIRASNFIVDRGSQAPADWLENVPELNYIAWIQSGNWRPGSHRVKVLTGPVFRLRGGRPVAYLPWALLEFSTLNLLARIQAVGNDFCMDPVVHWCMKKHQPVPISMGSPSLLLEGLSS